MAGGALRPKTCFDRLEKKCDERVLTVQTTVLGVGGVLPVVQP